MQSSLFTIQIIGEHQKTLEDLRKNLKILYAGERSPFYTYNTFQSLGITGDSILNNLFYSSRKVDLTVLLLTQDLFPHSVLASSTNANRANGKKQRVLLIGIKLNYYTIRRLFLAVNPDGFLLAHEVDASMLKHTMEALKKIDTVYSDVVLKMIRSESARKGILEETDRYILYAIQQGLKLTEIPLPLSVSTIHKRMQKMSKVFGLRTASKDKLIKAAESKSLV